MNDEILLGYVCLCGGIGLAVSRATVDLGHFAECGYVIVREARVQIEEGLQAPVPVQIQFITVSDTI